MGHPNGTNGTLLRGLNVTNVTALGGFWSGLWRVAISGANETNETVQQGGVSFCALS